MDKKSILIISLSHLDRDPRVYRQIQFLLDSDYTLCAAGYSDPGIEGIEFVPINLATPPGNVITCKIRRLRQIHRNHLPWIDCRLWHVQLISILHQLRRRRWDLIVANDYTALPLALELAGHTNAKVIFDAHEYFPRQVDHSLRFRMIEQPLRTFLLKRFLPYIDAMITVNEGIALEFRKHFGKPCHIITNAPFYENLEPSPLAKDSIRMIHHGAALPSRSLESMVHIMDLLDDRFTLDLMLIHDTSSSYKHIENLVAQSDRIFLRDPVPMQEIPTALNQYDIGLYMLSPKSFNQRMALPNKIFEFIQGRLAVATWPSPEMARIVNQYQCGIVADTFTLPAMATILNSLTHNDIIRYKQNSHRAAKTLCAESNRDIFVTLVQQLLGD